jgi:EAL domain-containing protein (putative c-di-GMP-specific phosphodiesterase class I)
MCALDYRLHHVTALGRMRNLEIRIAIDDFGTGCSSSNISSAFTPII